MEQHESRTVVPPLVGLPAEDAHNRALDSRLLAVDQDPSHSASAPGKVTAQAPPAGSQLEVGERVLIWVQDSPDEGGGGGGSDRVPVGPAPVVGSGTK